MTAMPWDDPNYLAKRLIELTWTANRLSLKQLSMLCETAAMGYKKAYEQAKFLSDRMMRAEQEIKRACQPEPTRPSLSLPTLGMINPQP